MKNDNQIITNIKFNDLEKFYVEQINIFGNFITEEKVIRNSLIIDEGDAYNKFLFDKSINNIKSRRIFKSVKSNINQSLNEKQNKVIDIYVEESQQEKYLQELEQEHLEQLLLLE